MSARKKQNKTEKEKEKKNKTLKVGRNEGKETKRKAMIILNVFPYNVVFIKSIEKSRQKMKPKKKGKER